jgi:hypothetical protein
VGLGVLCWNTCANITNAFNLLMGHPVDEDGDFVLLKARHFEAKWNG